MKYIKAYESFDNTMILYHGSPNKFNKFSLDNFRKTSNMSDHGYGIYLTDSKSNAEFYSKGGYIYKVEVDKDINLYDWNGKLTQNLIDTVSKVALDMNIIEQDLLDQINSVDRSIKNETGTVVGYDNFRNKHGVDKLRMYRIFENIRPQDKYPMTYDEWYGNLSESVFDSMKETSEFLIKCGIDGAYFKEKNVDSITYIIYDIGKVNISTSSLSKEK